MPDLLLVVQRKDLAHLGLGKIALTLPHVLVHPVTAGKLAVESAAFADYRVVYHSAAMLLAAVLCGILGFDQHCLLVLPAQVQHHAVSDKAAHKQHQDHNADDRRCIHSILHLSSE